MKYCADARRKCVRNGLAKGYYLFVILLFPIACRSGGRHGEVISTNLSMSSYAEARQHANAGDRGSTYYFPTLEIYNHEGFLLYRAHEPQAIIQVLQQFPESVRGMSPQADGPRLAKILEAIPDFKSRKEEIIGKKELIVLSVALEDCAGCALEEQALGDLIERLGQKQSVAVMEIKIAHP